MPDGTIGFRASGRVSGSEYREVLLPAIRDAAEGGEIRLMFALGPEFEEFEPGALWEDTKVGVTFRTRPPLGLEALRPGYRRRLDRQGLSSVRLDGAGRGEDLRPRRARGGQGLGRGLDAF
jgi:hypothetical protein